MKILGLMTGTSMDGLDCIYVDININKDYNLKYDILDYWYMYFIYGVVL